jgi:recombination protein RecA
MTKEEKLEKVRESAKKINKMFGDRSIATLSEKPATNLSVVSTGSLGLDIALGIGGLPKGRIVEIYGPESSGKTTLATHIMAEAQKIGGICAIVDSEHAFDKNYASQIGVNVDELFIAQPSCAEEALQTANELISGGGIDVVVIDSVAALVPKKERDGEVGDSTIGLQARLMGQALRMIVGEANKHGVLVIFINQLREKIGVMFGSPETTPGGNSLKFYASVRLDVRRSTSADNMVKSGDVSMGNLVKVKVIKNKVSPPFTTCEFDVLYGIGIDKLGEIIELGSKKGILKKWGKQITYLDNKYDITEFAQIIRDNEEFRQELEKQIKQNA